MFEALGRVMYRRRRWVLGIGLLLVAASAVWGTGVFGRLTGAGFDDPNSDSVHAGQAATAAFGRTSSDVVVLYSSADRTVDDPAFRDAVTGTVGALPADAVLRTTTFWSSGAPSLVSRDRHATYAVLTLRHGGDDLPAVEHRLAAPGLQTRIGGNAVVNHDINGQVGHDIGRAEEISMPVLLVLLVVIFGSLAAAGLPLAIGGVAILGSFAALRAFSTVTDVSVFAVNVVTIMGLGLAIDYGLFVVSRFREEMSRSGGERSVEDAVARTMATAGRTVAVSGTTVAISLAGLLIFPQVFLRSMGFGGMSAVLIAMLAALTLLPALLGMLGPRVDALSLRPLGRRVFRRPVAPAADDRGVWYRIAHVVMRHPVPFAVGITVLLLALASPFLRVQFGGIDERVLPAGTESRVVAETLKQDFPEPPSGPITAVVTLPTAVASPQGGAALQSYVARVTAVPGVDGATVTAAAGNTAQIAVAYHGDPVSKEARAIVSRIRAIPAPDGARALVGGQSALFADLLSSLGRLLPWMALLVVTTTFVLLFLAFGSVVLPPKALVMNVLSLGASFGALVWVFQEGHLSGFLHFESTGFLEATQPILVLAIVFGLSMDYEVFLMSRIREQYDRTGDNTDAVATGLQRTGRIITSAALLLCVVIAAFSLSGITFIKMIGVAMLIAIVVDATIVRTLLVPATMRLLGRANWYAPGPLRRLYGRYGIRESAGEPQPEPALTH
jgi:uncharacterized membrane protein YdfJ with MMPL/SSD domain